MIAPPWYDELELPESSYSVLYIQGYIKYTIKQHETLPINPSIHICINMINNSLVLEIKDGYKPELQTPEMIKLFGSMKN